MWLLPLVLVRLATSSLVLTGIRPMNGPLRSDMLRDMGDLWTPATAGSNILPCGEWGPQATRLEIPMGGSFTLEGTVPDPEGGGVLTVDAIFDPEPNFNLAGRLYKSTRFAVQDVTDQPMNFSVTIKMPPEAQPGPLSLQIKYVALVAKYAFYQCADLVGVDPNPKPWDAIKWWILGIILLAVSVTIAACVYCFCCRKCCSKRPQDEPLNDPAFDPATPKGRQDAQREVSVKNLHADREASESMEIEDMAHSESDPESEGAQVRRH